MARLEQDHCTIEGSEEGFLAPFEMTVGVAGKARLRARDLGERQRAETRRRKMSSLAADVEFLRWPSFLNPYIVARLDRENPDVASSVIIRNPDILGGVPVFANTRVPFQALLDYLEGGQTLDEFLDDFPTVTRGAAIAALEEAKALMIAHLE